MSHKQPELERSLRSVMEKYPHSQLRSGCTLTAIEESENWVFATYRNFEGEQKRIRSRFLVGADGKTGFVRKHYLQAKGVDLLSAERRVTVSTAVGTREQYNADIGIFLSGLSTRKHG